MHCTVYVGMQLTGKNFLRNNHRPLSSLHKHQIVVQQPISVRENAKFDNGCWIPQRLLNSATNSWKRNSRQRCRIPQQLQNSTTLQCTNAFPQIHVTGWKLRIKVFLVPDLRKMSVFANTLKRFYIRYHLTSELQTILPKTNEQNPAESSIFLCLGVIWCW